MHKRVARCTSLCTYGRKRQKEGGESGRAVKCNRSGTRALVVSRSWMGLAKTDVDDSL